MRTRFSILAALLLFINLVLISCSSEREPGIEEIQHSVSISKTELEFDSNESSQTIKVNSTAEWKVSGNADWCQVSPSSGTSGSTVTITVSNNPSKSDRNTTLIFSCGTATARLSVVQYGMLESQYVDMKFEDENVKTTYNESSGLLTVEYPSGNVPVVHEGDAIVLSDEYENDIRVVQRCSVSGNKIELQTAQGNMCDLFKNVNFTLTTNPDLVIDTRATGRVITPTSVKIKAGGKSYTLYDRKSAKTRETYQEGTNLFSYKKELGKQELLSGKWGTLEWEKNTFQASLDGVFYFDFGETPEAEMKKGDLKTFRYFLDGNSDLDLLLKYSISRDYSKEVKEIIAESVVSVDFKFMVGTIPVALNVDADLGKRITFDAEAGAEATTGVNIHANGRLGLEYRKGEKTFTPFNSFSLDYNVYDPTFNAHGSAVLIAGLYPEIHIKFYRFLGPWIDLIPYLGGEMEAGGQVSIGGSNYANWTSKIFSGMDTTIGLDLDWGFFNIPLIKPIDIEGERTILFEAPQKVELLTEMDEPAVFLDKETIVKFQVFAKNCVTGTYHKLSNALVNLKTKGKIAGFDKKTKSDKVTRATDDGMNETVQLTDEDGIVQVAWTPIHLDDNLEAEIVDKSGAPVVSAKYAPNIMDNGDYEALKTLYESTNGNQWRNNENWLSDKPFNEWYGVTTNEDGFVSEINLQNNNLCGSAIIKRTRFYGLSLGFNALKKLNLSHNHLSGLDFDDHAERDDWMSLDELILDSTFDDQFDDNVIVGLFLPFAQKVVFSNNTKCFPDKIISLHGKDITISNNPNLLGVGVSGIYNQKNNNFDNAENLTISGNGCMSMVICNANNISLKNNQFKYLSLHGGENVFLEDCEITGEHGQGLCADGNELKIKNSTVKFQNINFNCIEIINSIIKNPLLGVIAKKSLSLIDTYFTNLLYENFYSQTTLHFHDATISTAEYIYCNESCKGFGETHWQHRGGTKTFSCTIKGYDFPSLWPEVPISKE